MVENKLEIGPRDFDAEGLKLCLAEIGAFRYLYPNLSELVLHRIDCTTETRNVFSPRIFFYLHLTRLEIIETDLHPVV